MGRKLYGSSKAGLTAAPRAVLTRAAAGLATAAAATLLAVAGAHWFWRIAAPAPSSLAPVPLPEGTAGPFAVSPPFGAAAAGPAVERGAPRAAASAPTDLRLLGVIAGREGAGQALFRVAERGPVLVSAGQDVTAAVRLDAVFPDRVRLTGRGETSEMLLRNPSPLVGPVPAGPAKVATTDRGLCVAPPGYKGPQYRINAELLGGMATQPDSWKPMLAASAGGLIVRDASGFAALLGLQAGDRLRDANGIPLTATDDLLVAVVKPLQGNQPVRVRGTRAGGDLELLLVNASACAPR